MKLFKNKEIQPKIVVYSNQVLRWKVAFWILFIIVLSVGILFGIWTAYLQTQADYHLNKSIKKEITRLKALRLERYKNLDFKEFDYEGGE